MIGLVLVTHGRLAIELVSALEHVVGPQENIATVCIGPDDDMEQRRAEIVFQLGEHALQSGGGALQPRAQLLEGNRRASAAQNAVAADEMRQCAHALASSGTAAPASPWKAVCSASAAIPRSLKYCSSASVLPCMASTRLAPVSSMVRIKPGQSV